MNQELIKTLRLTMGVKACDLAQQLGIGQGNFSKVERGLIKNKHALEKVKKIYNEWRIKEIMNLNNKIEYLNSFK